MKESDYLLLTKLSKKVGYTHPESFRRRSDTWTEILIQVMKPLHCSILELGSGWSPKIMFALSTLNFTGRLTVVDLDEKALTAQGYVKQQMQSGFELKTIKTDLFDYQIQDHDVIVGNHLIDDLIAAEFSKKFQVDYTAVFSNSVRQVEFWDQVRDQRFIVGDMVQKLCAKLSVVQPGIRVILNDYLSNFDERYGITNREEVMSEAWDWLKNGLVKFGFEEVGVRLDKDETDRWLVVVKKQEMLSSL